MDFETPLVKLLALRAGGCGQDASGDAHGLAEVLSLVHAPDYLPGAIKGSAESAPHLTGCFGRRPDGA